jgi:hypothetical protein
MYLAEGDVFLDVLDLVVLEEVGYQERFVWVLVAP